MSRDKTDFRRMTIPRIALTVTGLLVLCGSARAGYIFQNIIDPADPTFNQALSINNAGVIAGYFGSGAPSLMPPPFTATPNKGYTTGAPYTTFVNENFPGSFQTQVTGINNAGTTVGFWADSNGATAPNFFGFVDQGGTFTSVNNPNTPAIGPTTNQLLGLNDAGPGADTLAAGFYIDGGGNMQAYTYDVNLKSFTAVNPPGATQAAATGINNAGLISGFATLGGNIEAFLDKGGSFTFFEVPTSTNTEFLGVNNNGLAVGFYVDGTGGLHGLIYNVSNGTYVTLDDPNGIGTTTFNGVNDLGQITGFYVDGNGNTIGLLATSTPEPASLGLIGAGLLALGWRKFRSKKPARP
jgi:hypothetical protein